jgi:hypothetical protein
MIGCVDLLDVSTGGIKEYLTDFDISLKPNDLWPKVPSVAKVHCSDDDWYILGQELVEHGLCGLVDGSEVFSWSNKKLLSGMFGVSKHEFDEKGVEIMRLIMNLIPLNQICHHAEGDLSTLPMLGQVTSLHILLHERVFWSSEDLRCMFYLFRVPQPWSQLMCFNKLLGSKYLCSKVLGMGWCSSVAIAQHVHRQMLLQSPPSGAGLPPNREWRRDKPMPPRQLDEVQSSSYWKVYFDN